MGFLEIQFPTGISYGSRGGPGFNTGVTRLDSGAEERVSRWPVPIHTYDAGYGVRSWEDLAAVKEFYWSLLGAADGFRWKDWADYGTCPTGIPDARTGESLSSTDVIIGTGDGVQRDFQLIKFYSNRYVTRTRLITKPVEGSLLVAVNGVLQTEGVHYTANYTTGIITFGTAPASLRDVTAGFEFDVPVRFGDAADEALQSSWESFGHGDIPSIPIVEIINGLLIPEQYFHGGFYSHGDIAVSVTMTLSQGFLHEVRPTTTGLRARLPRADDISGGGIIIAVVNNGSERIEVSNNDESAVALTLNVGAIGEFLIAEDSGGAKTWLGK